MNLKNKIKYDLRNVLFSLVEFLGKVLCGRLAGYLHKGQLFAISSQVARSLAHAVIIIPLNKKV